MPTFVVVGAAKAGTTALYNYLGQHPEVYLPRHEEPSYFAFAGAAPRFRGPRGSEAAINQIAVTERRDYERLFDPADAAQARGDVSPAYLYWPGTAERIKRDVPDAAVCMVLRHPVDRAYSAYMHARREGKESLTFRDALDAEPGRIRDNWGFLWRYRALGEYAPQLRRYLSVFSRDRILVLLYDDLSADAVGVCRRIQGFIGVDPAFVPDVRVRHNASGIPRSASLYRLLSGPAPVRAAARAVAPLVGDARLRATQARLRNSLLRQKPLDAGLRAALVAEFQQGIEVLQEVLDRDLSAWLER